MSLRYDLVMNQPSAQSKEESFEQAQIGVALEHVNLLEAKFDLLEIRHSRLKESALLGLALLEIENPRAAVVAAKKEVESKVPSAANSFVPPAPDTGSDLDYLLWALRVLFKSEYAGWTPTLGKNRFVRHVHGVWEVIHSKVPARTTGPGSGVRVGVLDTAFYPQPWLAGGWTARFSDIVRHDVVPPVAQGHATFVTGLILSQAPGASVEVRRLLDEKGEADSWEAAEAIARFGQSGVDVLNLSFGSYTEDNEPPLILATAIDRLDPKVVVVAAAGNYHPVGEGDEDLRNRPSWPAALDDVIAVGAVTRNGDLAPFSPDAPWVDVHAAGVDLTSTYLDRAATRQHGVNRYEGWAKWQGTSFAAALVTGAVAAGTAPGQTSGGEAARDLLGALRADPNRPSVQNTHAKYLPLRTW
jgi:membrane-anchored mycosin MYCP